MEGDSGAGTSHRVAAILKGLEESGVVLTMLNRPREQQSRRNSSKPSLAARKSGILNRCSVETNTDCAVSKSFHSANRGVQISDDRYTSCYQVAHCSVRPSSPPVTCSEFPPQRSSPSYFEGNFEVGGTGSCDRTGTCSRSVRIRRGFVSPDRRPCDTEAFALSLRKYPSFPVFRTVSSEMVARFQRTLRKHPILSPKRTSSSEMLEKILRQTQAKFSPVQSPQRTKSTRSFHKEQSSKWKQPKYMQTYTKTQDIRETKKAERPRTVRREDDANVRRYVSTSNDPQRFDRRTAKQAAGSHLPNRTEGFSTTYDYLKPSQPPHSSRPRRSERDLRFEEIRRHVRSAIREIYNQHSVIFPMCPKVQKRYDEHKKHCSGRAVDSRMPHQQLKQASTSGLCRLLEFLGSYVSPESCDLSVLSNHSNGYQRTKASQYFEHEAGCRCGPDPNHVNVTCDCRPPYGEEYSCYDIDEEIHEWLSEIPVRSNERTEDKRIREDLVENLIVTLEKLLYDDDFEQNVRDVVTKCVNELPMWNSGTEQKKEQLKYRLIENLLNRIIPKPADKLTDEVKHFFDTLNYKYHVNTQKITDDVVKNLQNLIAVGPKNDDELKYLVESEIHKVLEKLPIKVDGNKNEALRSLANDFASKIMELQEDIASDLLPKESSSKGRRSSDKNKKRPCSLLGPCKRVELRPFYHRSRPSQYACDSNTCDYKNTSKKKSHVCDCCPKNKGKVTCICQADPNRVRYPCDCEDDGEYFNQSVDEEIDNWLNEIPVPINESATDTNVRKHMAKHLAETLKQLPDDNNFKESAKGLIEECLHNISMWSPDTEQDKITLKKQLTELLLDRITAISRQPDKLTVVIKKFIDSVDFGDNDVDRKTLTNNLIKRLKYLAIIAPEVDDKFTDVLISEISDILEQSLPQMNGSKSGFVHALAKKLAEEVKDSLRNIDIYENDTVSLKESFVKILSDWIDEVAELSELPPNMKEAKKVIDELANKLVNLQFVGTDKSSMKNIENEVQKSLKKLNISTKAMDNMIENLMDTITDTLHAKDKTKFERAHRREIFKEVSDWLKNKDEIEDLSPQEEYTLIKEIVDKIETAKSEGREDHQDLIIESLANAGIYINPDLQLDEGINRLKTFSAKTQETDLKDNIQKNMNEVIDKLNISEEIKDQIKNNLSKDLDNTITTSSLTTKKAIENMNEILLEKVDAIVEDSRIPKTMQTNLKDNLVAIINKSIQQIISAKDKDDILYTLLKDINYNIDKEQIPDIEKKNLKYKLKHMLNESSAMPFSNYVRDHVFENIDRIVSEAPIEKSVKDRLTNKLINIAHEKFHELPTQSVKDYIKDRTIKDIELIIDKAPLKENVKNDLNQMLKYIVNENLKQPFSGDVKDATLNQINETINDFLIPDTLKGDLIKKVTNVVSNNFDNLPYQTDLDHAKETIMCDINDVIDTFALPKAQVSHLKEELGRMLAEYLDRPYSDNQRDKLIVDLNKLINETPIPFDKKGELTFKLTDTVNKRLDNLSHQSAEEYAKESILKDIMRMVNETSLSNSEKEALKNKFEDIIEDCFPHDHLDALKGTIEEGIRNIIHESSIPQSEQHDLVDKMIDISGKILDESFYDDHKREHLHGMFGMIEKDIPMDQSYKDILKNELKSVYDKYLQDPNLLDIRESSPSYEEGGESNIDEKIIKQISDAIDETSIPINQKSILENKLQNMSYESNRPTDVKRVLKELYKTIEHLPISWQDKKALKSKLERIAPTDLENKHHQVKHTLLNDIESAIDSEAIEEEEKSKLKNKFADFVSLLDKPISHKAANTIKDGMYAILDESGFSKEKNRNLRNRIASIVSKLPTKVEDNKSAEEKILEHAAEVIDEAPIRYHLKKGLTAQLNNALSESFKQPLTRETKAKLVDDFVNIIDDVPITDYQRDNLKKRLTNILNKELEQLPIKRNDDVRDLLISDIDKILEEKSITKVNKAELGNKLRKAVLINMDEPLSDDIKNQIRQNIVEILDEAAIPKDPKNKLKEELDNIVTKNFRVASSHLKPADDISTALVRSICNVIKDAPISHDNKRYLKKKIEENLPQRLKEPMSNNLEETVNNELFDIISEVPISQAQKRVLKNYLSNTVSGLVHEHQSKVFKDDIKDNILQDVNHVIETLNIPKERKKQLKLKLKNLIDENFDKPLTVDNFKEIKQRIYEIVADAPVTKEKKAEVRRNLANIVENNMKSLFSNSNHKPDTKTVKPNERTKRALLQRIDTVLDSSVIPTDDKIYTKQMLESVADEILQQPPEMINDTINIILDDTAIPRNKRAAIGNKLHNAIVNDLNTQGTPDYRQVSAINADVLEDLDAVLKQLQIPSAQKVYLKDKIEDLMTEYLDKPPSSHTMQVIKDNILNIVSDMPISQNKKNILNNKLTDLMKTSTERQMMNSTSTPISKKPPTSIYLSPTEKNNAIREIDTVLDDLQLPSEQKKNLSPILKNMVQDTLEAPLATDTGETLKIGISKIIGDVPIYPTEKKNEIKNKLFDMVNNKIKPMIESPLAEKSFLETDTAGNILQRSKHDNIERENTVDDKFVPLPGPSIMKKNIEQVNSAINRLDTSTDIKSKLRDVVGRTIDKGMTVKTTESLKDDIAKVIAKAPMSKEKKSEIETTLTDVIDEHIAPVASKHDKIYNIKGTVLQDINNDLNAVKIPSDARVNLNNKIKNKVMTYLETPQSEKKLDDLKEDLNKIIDEAPVPENKKTQLRNNIRNNINRNTEYMPDADTLGYYNTSNATTMRYEGGGSNANDSKPSYSRSPQDASPPTGSIYEADDEDTKDSYSVSMPVGKGSKELTASSTKKKKLKETILKDFSDVINSFEVPRNKKADLKIKLNDIANANIDKLFSTPKQGMSDMKKVIGDKIGQIVDETSMGPAFTRQNKNDLKEQLVMIANKNIDAKISDNKGTGESKMLLSTIDKLPVPEHIKEELRNKIMKSPDDSISSQGSRRLSSAHRGRSSLISVIPEEGPVASTPKKGRKSWEAPFGSFSTIASESIMQTLSPEERDYWMQIQEAISKWLDDLPIDLDDETKEAIKREIANDIADRQQYLQLNPGARKSLQAELEDLQYQVYRRLNKVLNREDMQIALQAGDNLMQMMMAVEAPDIYEDNALEKSAELELHQQIMDVISETLPELEDASTEELDSFEIMRDELADAFIKLHYAGGNDEELNSLRKKISDEIEKFCNDYLKKYPNKPLCRKKLRHDLYTALKKVHPSEDVMRSAVEHVRLKDVVYEWLKDLPLEKQSATERLQTMKKLAILAKKLLDIEHNDAHLSDTEVKNKMERAITKFLKTLPLKSAQEKNIPTFTSKLIERLNRTKAARTFDASTRHSITLDDFLGSSTRRPLYPPCTLSAEDLEHLARIKKRACMAPDCLATLMKTNENKRHASVSPMSIESGAQTEANSGSFCMPPRIPPCSPPPRECPGQPSPSDQYCPMQFASSPCTQSLSHMDVQPQIIIKEYYWNSTNTAELQQTDSRLSGSPQRRTCFTPRPALPCYQKFSQTCQDKALSCTPCPPSPCTPRVITPRTCATTAPPQCFFRQRPTPQNSCANSEPPNMRYTRKERVIELGSLDELRKPSQKERISEDFASSTRNQEGPVWRESYVNADYFNEEEVRVDKGKTKVICKCKAKPSGNNVRSRWKHDTTSKDRAVLTCNDNTAMKRCLKCCGIHCPYPSFMYFRQ